MDVWQCCFGKTKIVILDGLFIHHDAVMSCGLRYLLILCLIIKLHPGEHN